MPERIQRLGFGMSWSGYLCIRTNLRCRGSRWIRFAYSYISVSSLPYSNISRPNSTDISRNKRIQRKGTTFTLIVGIQSDKSVFDSDHDGQRPDNQGQRSEHICLAGIFAEGRRIHVQGTCADVTVNNPEGLVGKPVRDVSESINLAVSY
jgi:hypothetical protein